MQSNNIFSNKTNLILKANKNNFLVEKINCIYLYALFHKVLQRFIFSFPPKAVILHHLTDTMNQRMRIGWTL